MSDDTIKNLTHGRWSIIPPEPGMPYSTGKHRIVEVGETDYMKARNSEGRFMKITFGQGLNADNLTAEEWDAIQLEQLEERRKAAIKELEEVIRQIDELKKRDPLP
jgi:hypothetical protein